MRGVMRSARLLIVAGFVVAVPVFGTVARPAADGGAVSSPLRTYLEKEIGLTAAEMTDVTAGRPVAKLLKTKTKDEVALFGIVRIDAPPEAFVEKYRDVASFEGGAGVRGFGRFKTPPELADVASLTIDDDELKEIEGCKTGDCSVKLSDRAIQALRRDVDWRTPKGRARAQQIIRREFVDYIANYQKVGDEALAIYNDQKKPQSIRDNFRQLLANSATFVQYDPQLVTYLEKFPEERPPDTEDIFFWQNGEFGLKPVVRASHIVIHRNAQGEFFTYAIASKMLFASHYFRAALELKSLVPEPLAPGAKSFYLVCLNRSYIDGLTGLKGRFIRGTVTEKSQKSLVRYLANAKLRVELADRLKPTPLT